MELIPISQIPKKDMPTRFKYGQIYRLLLKAIHETASILISHEEIDAITSGGDYKKIYQSVQVWARARGIKVMARMKPEGLYLFPVWIGEFSKSEEEKEWFRVAKHQMKKVKTAAVERANREV